MDISNQLGKDEVFNDMMLGQMVNHMEKLNSFPYSTLTRTLIPVEWNTNMSTKTTVFNY